MESNQIDFLVYFMVIVVNLGEIVYDYIWKLVMKLQHAWMSSTVFPFYADCVMLYILLSFTIHDLCSGPRFSYFLETQPGHCRAGEDLGLHSRLSPRK